FIRDDSDTTSADNAGTVIVAANGKRWKRSFNGLPFPEWFGAKADGTTDDTPALQAAINAHKIVRLSLGKTYYLATPIQVSSGMAIISDMGRLAGFFAAPLATLKPATCAIQTSNYQSQYIGFTMRHVGITGGTLQVDLGLFH